MSQGLIIKSNNCRCGGRRFYFDEEDRYRLCVCELKRQAIRKTGIMFDTALGDIVPRDNQKKVFEYMKSNPKQSFFFYGLYGTGKTHMMAAQFINAYYINPDNAKWINDTDLATISRDIESDTFHDIIQDLNMFPGRYHYFIDDIGKSKMTDWLRQDLYRLIDTLYRNNHRLSVSSQHSIQTLADDTDQRMPGGAITRRIDDMTKTAEL